MEDTKHEIGRYKIRNGKIQNMKWMKQTKNKTLC